MIHQANVAIRERFDASVIPPHLELLALGQSWRVGEERYHLAAINEPDAPAGRTIVLSPGGVVLGWIDIHNVGRYSAAPLARFKLLHSGVGGQVEDRPLAVRKNSLWAVGRTQRRIDVEYGARSFHLARSGLRRASLSAGSSGLIASYSGVRVEFAARYPERECVLIALLLVGSGCVLDTSHPLLQLLSNLS